MRYILFILMVWSFFMNSCKKNKLPVNNLSGVYTGTFQRSILNKISNVTLTLSSDNFEGQSEYIHYPDVCNGTFSIVKDTVLFTNGCFYTADFDWSYILSGKYSISTFGDSLIMTRGYDGVIYYKDTYKLKKQPS